MEDKQDYSSMLDQLHFPKKRDKFDEASSVQTLLSLVALHHSHGHHKEAVECLRTALQLTQDMKQEEAVDEAMVRRGEGGGSGRR